MNGFGKVVRRAAKAGGWAVAATAGAALLGWGALEAAVRWGGYPGEALARHEAGRVAVDRTGEPLRVWLNADGQDCRPSYEVREGDWIAVAAVAAEDGRFWRHGGVDWRAVARAAWQNVRHGRRISGASTITTQVWRLAEPKPRTLLSKVKEWVRAMQLERRAGKAEILAEYLNRAPFGGNVTGIEAAARRWFGKSAHDLNLAEAALLAGVPQSPARFRPDRGGEGLRKRQAYVLRRMRELGTISEEQEREAGEEGRAMARPWGYPRRAEHFAVWVGWAGGEDGRGTIRTTLDPEAQATAERVLREKLGEPGFGGISGAVVVLDVAGGGVLAMVGSPDFRALPAGQVNGALAARGAGSTLKPFAYAAAFDGGWLTPDSVLADREVQYRDFAPRNFTGRFRGRATAREALVDSLNLPAIAVVRRLGAERFLEVLRETGLGTLRRSAEEYGAGLALGGAEVRLLELANAYACLARGGIWKAATGLEAEAERVRGEEGRRVFSEGASWLVWDILSGEERAMDLTGHEMETTLPEMAWKTGTSAGLRDAWAVAWNGRRVVGVWMGRTDGKGASVLVGRTAAVPVAWGIFRELAQAGEGGMARPAEVESRRICTESGLLAGERCPVTAEGYCLRRRTVWERCLLAHETEIKGSVPLNRGGDETGAEAGEEVEEDWTEEEREGSGDGGIRIVTPADGAVYRAMPKAGEGDAEPECRVNLRAEAGGGGRLYWFVDGRYVGATGSGEGMSVAMEPGSHEVGCADEAGGAAGVGVRVEGL